MKSMRFLLIFSFTLGLMAQKTVSGNIKDKESSEVLVGANIVLKGTSLGAASDADGNYNFEVPAGNYIIVASYIGYVDNEKRINVSENIKVDFEMKADVFSREVTVTAQRATFRETPVAFTDVNIKQIEEHASTLDITNVMAISPGVYASEQGGGSGDSRISIRGFDHVNMAVMINGVPVNDMENGAVYWSNWSGLADVTSSIQIQRGLGATKLSSSSIGGTINVLTKSTDAESKILVKTELGPYQTYKYGAAYSSGLIDNTYAFSFMVSRKTSDGYADATYANEFTYFASLGFVFENNIININATGTPQNHGPRFNQQTDANWKKYGKRYNASWGKLRGETVNTVENFYHKPVIDLNHTMNLGGGLTLNNVIYVSFGTGGGKGTLGSSFSGALTKSDGTMNIDSAYNFNAKNIDNTYSATLKKSTRILRSSNNNHNWYGLISSVDMKEDEMTLTGGLDFRYYKGEHYREVQDLWGGDYFIDNTNLNSPNRMTKVGDKVAYYNDGLVRQYGIFGQIENNFDKEITSFINGTLYFKDYKRIDYFNYLDNDPNRETDWKSYTGYNIKAGLNLNIDKESNIFSNIGMIVSPPSFNNIFINNLNNFNDKVKNEKVLSFELGYGYRNEMFALNLNGYYTNWKDKYYRVTIGSGATQQLFYAYEGVTQVHQGFEYELRFKPVSFIDIELSGSYADNRFSDDFNMDGFDANNNSIGSGKLYLKDLYIPLHPMSSNRLSFTFSDQFDDINIFLKPTITHSSRHFSSFDPLARFNKPELANINSWELPEYFKTDIALGMTFHFEDTPIKELKLNFNIYNIFDKEYITDGTDGSAHDFATSRFFYARERYFTFGTTLNF